MAALLCILTGFLVAGGVFLMLDRNLVKFLFGLVLLSNAANLVLLNAGRLTRYTPAFIADGDKLPPADVANALPQAFILTAIVISFGLLAFALILAYRAYQEMGTIDMDALESHTFSYDNSCDGYEYTCEEGVI